MCSYIYIVNNKPPHLVNKPLSKLVSQENSINLQIHITEVLTEINNSFKIDHHVNLKQEHKSEMEIFVPAHFYYPFSQTPILA